MGAGIATVDLVEPQHEEFAFVLDRRVDAAVHSFKDMASRPTLGLRQYFPEREDVCDVLVGGALEDLPQGARVDAVGRRARLHKTVIVPP